QALFDIVYRHWTTLPQDTRPRLYLHGLSLGAFLSQETVPLLDLYADPIHGALWTGSPYLSEFWRMVQARRHPDSPASRPRFGNGSLIRTVNQNGGLERFDAGWGPMRFVFLQYGSDPIVFFDWSLAWARPDWLTGDRAPDLSPEMRWIPVVTLFQVGLDMAVALGTLGYGHDYIARHYIPAWAATLDPEGWTSEDEARLVAHLAGLVPR
ncbi:MAG: alpha/beta-hydrolase family protein, partial [Paracoccus hibiscisoli]|uniref:alpha/beta-hydrolase family protein n=1 Tax=Paracoccus hibiscisoli TaxID=2023261 RepID=UPI00391B0D0B